MSASAQNLFSPKYIFVFTLHSKTHNYRVVTPHYPLVFVWNFSGGAQILGREKKSPPPPSKRVFLVLSYIYRMGYISSPKCPFTLFFFVFHMIYVCKSPSKKRKNRFYAQNELILGQILGFGPVNRAKYPILTPKRAKYPF